MKIFISHASEQREIADSIEVALSGEGHVVFLDRSDLPSGETYNDRIRDAIAQSDLFIFLISPEAVSKGRYTITELGFAREKWKHPSDHVLPVMIQTTELGSVPVYLKAVTILEPEGNIPAAVAEAVARLTKPWSQRLRPWAAVFLLILLGAGVAAWWNVRHLRTAREASALLESGQRQHQSGKYSAAWDLYARAAAVSPGDRDVAMAQERLAMNWLDNIRVTVGSGTFAAIADKVEPVLARCAGLKEPRRAADCQAHIGWADFLRSREGIGGLNPAEQYRRALELDPENVYAHTMWGFDILRSGGSVERARPHFEKALASGRERAYVRHLDISGLLWSHEPETENEVVRVANDMRLRHEVMPGDPDTGSDAWRLWGVYYDRFMRRRDLPAFLAALPAADHLATFRWLFPEADIPREKRNLFLFMRASLEEHAGDRAAALASFTVLRDILVREHALAAGGPLPEATVAALERLSR